MNRDYLKAKFKDKRSTTKIDTSEAGG
jgi:hypothetical protein